ncbi:Protein PhnA [hydrothermal vent metagenome]|uniref:Protein PhnA n=1 Tax=hydrothermal vent metagenome TaxID=652676 RepID=A0A3B0XRP2_9ZZZZ
MSIEQTLLQRSESRCELCGATENLAPWQVPTKSAPSSIDEAGQSLLICPVCHEQINHPKKVNANHWRCLNDSMWSQVPAVQVIAWRMLNRLSAQGWTQDLLDMLYLEEEILNWAQAEEDRPASEDTVIHKDSNGAVLEAGDTITLIKDLNVKGANFTAKRGTAVRSISLVSDNAEHIEGRVEGQRIVILTKFVKKSN